ncbi:thiamine pyrophosphate-binding protein [Halobaculum sp. EA56]|uniref:thiamine pyrophosphate-binding protein n=1 Tax=Halobaculum sp. EA56 TaxID=3421648 RepID=UPI003EBF2D19
MTDNAADDDERTEEQSTRPPGTGAEAVVRALERAGVEHAFGVQGGAIMPVYDALSRSDVRHVTMAHEQGAAHAADAYGVVSGTPGVCLATSGPGATNLVTGLAGAAADSDPVLALTGQAPSHLIGRDAFQETDTTAMTEPVTKENYLATDPDTVGDTVAEAFERARSGRPGPTLVDLPKDVSLSRTDREADGSSRHGRIPEPGAVDGGDLDGEHLDAAADALAAADRPVVLAGGGVIAGDAWRELRAFAVEFGVPVATTTSGRGSIPEDHRLALGVAGASGTDRENAALRECDALLAVGTRFDDRLAGAVEPFAPDATVVHVDVDPAEIDKNVRADYPLVGDAATVLERLHEAMPAQPAVAERRERCRRRSDGLPPEYPVPESGSPPPEFVVEATDALTPDDTVVTTDVDRHLPGAMRYWTCRNPRTWVASHGLGTPGYGLPAAVGARVAAGSDRSVVCFTSVGSVVPTVRELAVAVRQRLDLTVIVFAAAGGGTLPRGRQPAPAGGPAASPESGAPGADALAEAFGARGWRLETADEVEDTLREALGHAGPSVVDARVDVEGIDRSGRP